MSKYLTGNKGLDMEIILNLRDDEIEPVCNVNKYVKDICESEIFWYRRIAKRIEYAKNENFKMKKDFYDIPINGENINKMKKYLGFEKLKELNDYLNNFLPKSLYFIFNATLDKEKLIDSSYKIGSLPKYINKEELIFELRRQFLIEYYKPRINNFSKSILLDLAIPNLKLKLFKMSEDEFALCKKLEVI